MPFKTIEDVENHPAYLRMLKMELGRIPGSGTPYRLYDKFKFDEGKKSAPLLLLGVVPSPVLDEIKKRGAPAPAIGTCTVNEADELVFDGGGDHGRLEAVVRSSGAPQKLAPKGGGAPPPPPPPKAPYKTKEMLEVLQKQERDVDPRHVRQTTIAGKDVELHDKRWGATGSDMSALKVGPSAKPNAISVQYLKGEARDAHRVEVKGSVKGPGGSNVKVGIAGNVPHKNLVQQAPFEDAVQGVEDRVKNQFVMDQDGAVYAGSQEKSKGTLGRSGKIEMIHHSSFLAGEAVAAAGEIFTNKDGVVKEISNVSGHYRPGEDQALQSIDGLRRMGVDVKNVKFQYMDQDGAADGMATELEKGGAETFKKRHDAVDELNEAIARKPTRKQEISVGGALFAKRRQVAEAQAENDAARRAEEEPLERERRDGFAAAEADALLRKEAGEAQEAVDSSLEEEKKALQEAFEEKRQAVRQRQAEALAQRLAGIDQRNDERIDAVREIREKAAAKKKAKREAEAKLLKPEIRAKKEAHDKRVEASADRLALANYQYDDEKARLTKQREAAQDAANGDADALAVAQAAFDAGVAVARDQRHQVHSQESEEVRKAEAERDEAIAALEIDPVHRAAIKAAQQKGEAIAKATSKEIGQVWKDRRQELAGIQKAFAAEAGALKREIEEARTAEASPLKNELDRAQGQKLAMAVAKLSAAEELFERQTGDVRRLGAKFVRAARKRAQADLLAVRAEMDAALAAPPPPPPSPPAAPAAAADPAAPAPAPAPAGPAAASPDLTDARILAHGILEERGEASASSGAAAFAYTGEPEAEDDESDEGSFAYGSAGEDEGDEEEADDESGPGVSAYSGRAAEEEEGESGEKEDDEGALIDPREARRREKGKEKEEREKGV